MMSSVYHFCLCRFIPVALLSFIIVSSDAADSCLDCHASILKQFTGSSHHIQGVAITAGHCYSCHWEAALDGTIDSRYHRHSPAVDLVVWVDGKRPAEHISGKTSITFTANAMGSDRERDEVAKVTVHCLSCPMMIP